MKKIAVVGSINVDYFIEIDAFPKVGETVLGSSYFTAIGGKGANQAVAAARLGAEVSFFGSVGDDEGASLFCKVMKQEGINCQNVQSVANIATGSAFIELSCAENRIIVVPGANAYTSVAYLEGCLEKLLEHDIIVFQLETPIDGLEYVVPKLFEKNKVMILNPAPAMKVDEEILNMLTYITPNEHEYEMVFGWERGLQELLQSYPNKVIVTQGTNGVVYFDGVEVVHIPAIKVEAVDSTGAGDTFSGAFAVGIGAGMNLRESIVFASIAAGLSVRCKGAQTGMPSSDDVWQWYENNQNGGV